MHPKQKSDRGICEKPTQEGDVRVHLVSQLGMWKTGYRRLAEHSEKRDKKP